jgi:hypothetical protein
VADSRADFDSFVAADSTHKTGCVDTDAVPEHLYQPI